MNPNLYFQTEDYYSCVRIIGYKLPLSWTTREAGPSLGLNVLKNDIWVKLFWLKTQ